MKQLLERFARRIDHSRVRRHAVLLAVVIWFAYAITVATPGVLDRFGHVKGVDFLHFYTQGSLALHHRGDQLYNLEANRAETERLVPEATGVYFVPAYGPQYSMLFMPFAALPFLTALALWSLLSAMIYAGCAYVVLRSLPDLRQHRTTVWLLAAAFPGFAALIMFGQNSAIALVAFTLAFVAFRKKRSFLAGCALGLLAYKPQLAIAPAAVLLLSADWRAMLGALAVSTGQMIAAWLYFGRSIFNDYAVRLTQLGQVAEVLEPKPYLMHSLRTFWSLLVPWRGPAVALYVASAAFIIVLLARTWRRQNVTSMQYALLLIATVLVTPHLSIYDLVLLAPALLILGDWILRHSIAEVEPTLKLLLYFSYWIALLGPIAGKLHVQISVLVFAALFWFARKAMESEERGEASSRASKVLVATEAGNQAGQ